MCFTIENCSVGKIGPTVLLGLSRDQTSDRGTPRDYAAWTEGLQINQAIKLGRGCNVPQWIESDTSRLKTEVQENYMNW